MVWKYVTTVSGWVIPIGGNFQIEANVTLPNDHHSMLIYGAKDTSEVGAAFPDVTCTVSYPDATEGASIDRSPQTGTAPLTVNFSIRGGQGTGQVEWDFGDESPIERGGNNISHTYTRRGTYHTQARLTDTCGNKTRHVGTGATVRVTDTRCYDPPGEEGDYGCSDTTRIKCKDGVWVIVERDSHECGYIPPDIPDEPDPPDEPDIPDEPGNGDTGGNGQPDVPGYCTNPYGTRGDVFCDDTTLMRCDGTRWVVQEYNSIRCPPQSASTIPQDYIYMGIGLAAAFGLAYAMTQRKNKR